MGTSDITAPVESATRLDYMTHEKRAEPQAWRGVAFQWGTARPSARAVDDGSVPARWVASAQNQTGRENHEEIDNNCVASDLVVVGHAPQKHLR
jgi:hypothetical protein